MMEQKATPLQRTTSNSPYPVRDFQASDRQAVVELANEVLGQGYYFPDPKAGWIRVIVQDQKLVAFCYSSRQQDSNGSQFGMIKTLAVSPEAQNQGLAGALLDDAIQLFQLHQLDYAVFLAWKKQSGVILRPKLERLGFEGTTTLKRNWYRSSLEVGFDCPECGTPCICDAVWFEKKLLSPD